MSVESRANWHLTVAAGFMALGAAILPTAAEAGAADLPHACYANDSIVMGKRLAPRPDVVRMRLNSPACREHSGPDASSAEEADAIQRELERIDEKLTGLLREEGVSMTPASEN